MPLTDVKDTNPPTYEPCEDKGCDDNDDDGENYIFPTPGSETEEAILSLHPYNWCAFRCNLEKDLTESATEEEKSAWDQYLIPVRKQFDNFEDTHGYYRTLSCRKSSVDAAFKRDKRIF